MNENDTKFWWQYGYVWLIIAGPLLVVIAGFITLYLAIRTPDPVIDDYYRKGIEINKTLNAERDSLAPAGQARNHAATGIKPAQP
ncbi:MAG TPA: FixH family protein [Methylotenera sp.]|nr:FixH family protein [Methylotenera sp.]HPV44679.1 FixH family protein [Methylotenera sp.]